MEDEYGKQFTDIRFLAGSPKKEMAGKTTVDFINSRLAFREKMYDQPLTDKEKKEISAWTHVHIKDEKLRKTFEKMIARSYEKDKAEAAHGYHPCIFCGQLIPKAQTLCIRCENKLEKTEEGAFILILKENPHYKYEDCLSILKNRETRENPYRAAVLFLMKPMRPPGKNGYKNKERRFSKIRTPRSTNGFFFLSLLTNR